MGWWSIWLLVGVLCIGLELIIPGLVIIFFGFGAIFTSVFSLIPFINQALWLQIIIFIAFSVLSLIFLRKKFTPVFKGTVFYPDKKKSQPDDEFADVIETVFHNKEGRIKYKGTTWNARSLSEEIPRGSVVKVLKREGLTYIVEKTEK
ncbi:NfeD family protein [Treponema putidum]|uniref:NfeD family protein n=1 Tax=Treponema putidum TaxID=221027 RepID=A0AAE9MTL4_9SPIR|nr:NfeD family protein [Treponema putidum]AIN94677.1 nodulation efficiency protein D [Treponema putidum]TWI77541.1 membrane protein implicated in regulation of membrane protease activity [Treponema putidum]UTY28693.1 NfeD family protein [Treponema putidum]UTY31124.1 NfeD family protein [Treponema putidum]UTY33561.1 NfeD family protein [Treponema putidum]